MYSNSFKYDTYTPVFADTPLSNPYTTDNETFTNKKKFIPIDGQQSLEKLQFANGNKYLKRLERTEQAEQDENFVNLDDLKINNKKEQFTNQPLDKNEQYLNYLIQKNLKNINPVQINFQERYIYIVLIIILFVMTIVQKSRIQRLQDIMMLSHVQNTPMSNIGL